MGGLEPPMQRAKRHQKEKGARFLWRLFSFV
jgi:hypothetical protein